MLNFNYVNRLSNFFLGYFFFGLKKLIKMEPQSQSIITNEYLKNQNFVMLIRILALNLRCNWDALPWAEKSYEMVKEIFVRKFCKSGHSADLAFEYIYQLKLYIRSDEVEVDEIVDLEFLKKIDPDYMIIG